MFHAWSARLGLLFSLTIVLRYGVHVALADDVLRRTENCGTDPRWAPTAQAWDEAETDQNLSQWWNKLSESNPPTGLTNQLARRFGNKYTDYSCSIIDQGSCIIPGCQIYVDTGSPIWTYLALNAIVNMDTFLNRVWQGIETGQTNFGQKVSAIAQTFFPWRDPTVGLGEAAFWIDATVGSIFGFVDPESRFGKGVVVAIQNFASAGAQEAQLKLTPDPDLTLEQGTAAISVAASQSAKKSQAQLEAWANILFSGAKDAVNNTILSYLRGGSFIASVGPSNEVIEQFWEDSLTARTINSQWLTRPNFITFARTENRSTDVGPEVSKYYSDTAEGVYYLYQWSKGHLSMPDGLMQLSTSTYGITPDAVTESSARAFEVAKYNYTNQIALDELQTSLFNTTSNPILDGARWTGLWTIPVCDMGDHLDWNGQYDQSNMAPCCCGANCEDTATFVQIAQLHSVQSYLRRCRKQLKGTDLEFDEIDYGFKINKFTPGIIAAIVVPPVIVVIALINLCAS